jgi:hypothetical protein
LKMASERSEVFERTAVEYGLEPVLDVMRAAGVRSHASLTYLTSFVPGMPSDAMLVQDVFAPILGAGHAASPLRPALRRLWTESYSITLMDVKRRLEQGPGGAPRRLSSIELQARRTAVQAKITGLSLTGELNVSDALILSVVHMSECESIKYVEWSACTKRELEVAGVKEDSYWSKGDDSVMREHAAPAKASANLGGDLRLSYALMRRGIAMEAGDVMSFKVHEVLRERLLQALSSDPPPGYAAVDLDMIKRADMEFWKQVSERSEGRIKPSAPGVFPLDPVALIVVADSRFTHLLNFLPAASMRAAKRPEVGRAAELDPAASFSSKKRARLRKQTQGAPPPAPAQGKGAGKSKGGKSGGGPVPADLVALGCVSMTPGMERICYGYNTPARGCTGAAPGGSCNRGKHVCAKCFQVHPAIGNH